MTEGRKRCRDAEENFLNQAKMFISQRQLDLNNPASMKLIFDKTISLLYAGAQKNHKAEMDKINNPEMEVDGNDGGEINGQDGPPVILVCDSCPRRLPANHRVCSRCNLKTCVDCRTFCTGCDVVLCYSCVDIFGCCTIDNFAICLGCKQFIK